MPRQSVSATSKNAVVILKKKIRRRPEGFLFRFNLTPIKEKEISVLQIIHTQGDLGQRDLAQAIGISLGMTNVLLKRLAGRGWLLIKKINARNFQYALTPEGMLELSQRSFNYLKRTIKNVVDYKEKIRDFVAEVKEQGFRGIHLAGSSDLDFILEHFCRKTGIRFSQEPQGEGWITLFGENERNKKPNLADILNSAGSE